MRQRMSPIWKMPKKEFVALFSGNIRSVRELLIAFGLRPFSHNYCVLKKRAEEEGIDWLKLTEGWKKNRAKKMWEGNKIPTSKLLTENNNHSRNSVKKRVIEEGLLENKCSRCGQGMEWFGEKLVLVLDHINGIHNDHRIENLRMLCPNCNSQQNTFSGRHNKGKRILVEKKCECGAVISRYSSKCQLCSHKTSRRVERPPLDILKKDIDEIGWEAVGRKYGVSGNAVRKWFYCPIA